MKAIIPTLVLVIGLLDASVFAVDTKGETGTVWGWSSLRTQMEAGRLCLARRSL